MAAPVAPGLRSALKGAYNEFTEADGLLAQKRADIAAREQLLTEKTIALQQRKAELLAQIAEKKRLESISQPPRANGAPLPPPSSDPSAAAAGSSAASCHTEGHAVTEVPEREAQRDVHVATATMSMLN